MITGLIFCFFDEFWQYNREPCNPSYIFLGDITFDNNFVFFFFHER